MRRSRSAATPFARRLFAILCGWLALSVVLGALRAPLAGQTGQHPLSIADASGHATLGWPPR